MTRRSVFASLAAAVAALAAFRPLQALRRELVWMQGPDHLSEGDSTILRIALLAHADSWLLGFGGLGWR